MKETMIIDWTKLFTKYRGLWIALAEDEKTVIASSKNGKEAYAQALKRGVKVPILLNVPLELKSYIGKTFFIC